MVGRIASLVWAQATHYLLSQMLSTCCSSLVAPIELLLLECRSLLILLELTKVHHFASCMPIGVNSDNLRMMCFDFFKRACKRCQTSLLNVNGHVKQTR